MRETARGLPGDALERVVLVTVDLPYAVARRHLRSGDGRLPARLETLVEDNARAILRATDGDP